MSVVAKSALPESVTDVRLNLVGLAALLVATVAILDTSLDMVDVAVLLMAAAVGPVLVLDLLVRKVHRRPSTGLDWDRPARRIDPARVGTKLVGAAGALGAVGLMYFLAPEYQGSFYDHFYGFLWRWGPPAAVFGVGYLALVDSRMVDPHDGYWHAGSALLGRWERVRWEVVADFARTWVVKGFFVPLMFTYLTHQVDSVREFASGSLTSFMAWYHLLWAMGFLVDLAFTTAGYLVTLRVVDTHVRSAQPTLLGWAVALLCYQPFFSLFNRLYIFYDNGHDWDQWLTGAPVAKVLWGVVLLSTTLVFAWCTVAFGARFSNLTNRGVITSGPYRYSKHPAYLAKCLGFWMLYIPFVPHGNPYEVVRDCFWLGVLCLVYYARARTEEQHLSEDPTYVQYALWMNEHGLLASLGRHFPALRYRPPV